jgi:chromosomal replication initiator protein
MPVASRPPIRYNQPIGDQANFFSVRRQSRTEPDLTNGVVILPFAGPWMADETNRAAASNGATREFVVGPENRLAAATIERLLETPDDRGLDRTADRPHPGPGYPLAGAEGEGEKIAHLSPVVFYGASGSGKSHLAHGLAEVWKRLRPNESVVLVKASEFAQQYAKAVDKHSVAAWRAPFRSADLLVLEDLIQLASKAAAQIELSQMLDALTDRGALAVITTRLPPHELTNFHAGLQSRLTAGLCVPLLLPEAEARRQILVKLCDARRIALSDNTLRTLARALVLSAPELAGVLINLEHAARSTGQPLDDRLAQAYLSRRNRSRQPPLRAITTHTARHFALRVAELRSASRRRGVVVARDVAMYLARQLTSMSLKQIGHYFGGRDHTTVLHGCRKTESLMRSDVATQEAVVALRQRLALEE